MAASIKSLIFYIIVIFVIALVSLAITLNFTAQTVKKENINIEIYIGGEKVNKIVCTKIDANNYSHYDCKGMPCSMDIFAYKNGKPLVNTWITVEGCGLNDAQKTNDRGYATFSLKSVVLPPGISHDRIEIIVLSNIFYLDVFRG